jgi:hypothetical protein
MGIHYQHIGIVNSDASTAIRFELRLGNGPVDAVPRLDDLEKFFLPQTLARNGIRIVRMRTGERS